MDIWQVLRTTIRRWYVALPVLVLGVAASYLAAASVAVEYTSDASVLLVNPEPGVEGDRPPTTTPSAEDPTTGAETSVPETADGTGNPWLSFSGSLNTAAQAIQLSVTSQETRLIVEEEGLSTDYAVTPDRRNPILLVEVTSSDPDATQATLERVVGLMGEDLERRQTLAGAPTTSRIEAEILAMDATPERATAARLRVQIVALGLACVAAVLAALLVDLIARRRSPRAGTGRAEEHSDGPGGTSTSSREGHPGGLLEVERHDRGRRTVSAVDPDPQPEAGSSDVLVLSSVRPRHSAQGFNRWTRRAQVSDLPAI